MASVFIDPNDCCIVNGATDVKCSSAVIADHYVVLDGLIQFMVVVVFVFQLRDPLRPGPIEDEFDFITLCFNELLGRLEAVGETTEVSV